MPGPDHFAVSFNTLGIKPLVFQDFGAKPVTLESIGIKPLLFEKLINKPVTLESIGIKPLLFEKLINKPVTLESMGVKPLLFEKLINKPVTLESMRIKPLALQDRVVKPLTTESLSLKRAMPGSLGITTLDTASPQINALTGERLDLTPLISNMQISAEQIANAAEALKWPGWDELVRDGMNSVSLDIEIDAVGGYVEADERPQSFEDWLRSVADPQLLALYVAVFSALNQLTLLFAAAADAQLPPEYSATTATLLALLAVLTVLIQRRSD